MALKPTIYKLNLALSDLEHDCYQNLNLTLAQHPSETKERMMVRVLAFCLHLYQDADRLMTFTKGLSATEEPDIWRKGFDEQTQLWIDVGEPSFDRVKKSCRQAQQSYVYCFNAKASQWWKQSQAQFSDLPVNVRCFDWQDIQALADLVTRTMDLSVTLSEKSAFVAAQHAQVEVNWQQWQ